MTNVPMTRPEAALAIHNTKHGHSVTWARLDSGRIILSARGCESSISGDDGLTWSESLARAKKTRNSFGFAGYENCDQARLPNSERDFE